MGHYFLYTQYIHSDSDPIFKLGSRIKLGPNGPNITLVRAPGCFPCPPTILVSGYTLFALSSQRNGNLRRYDLIRFLLSKL